MDPRDRMTAQELKAMQGSSWVAIIVAILGFAAAAGFGGMYFLNYSEAKLAIREAEDARGDHATEIGQLRETAARLEEELNGKRDEIDRYSAQLNEAKLKTQEEKNRADSLADKVKEQGKRIERLESGNQEVLKLRGELAGKDAQIRAAEGLLQSVRNSLSNTQTKLSDAKSENEKLEKELSRVRRELDDARQQATAASVGKATADVLQSQLRDKERLVDDLKEKVKKAEEALQESEKEVDTLRETLGKSGKEAEELQKAKDELSNRDREIGRKDAEIKNLTEKKDAEIKNLTEKKETEIQGLTKKMEKLEEQADSYRKVIDSLRNTLALRGDVSEQVKSLSDALAGRDESIKKKDEEIVALKEKIDSFKEGAEQAAETTEVMTGELQKQMEDKDAKIIDLQKGLEGMQNERDDLQSRLKSEERATKMVEEGEELEQLKFVTGIWHTGNAVDVQVSDNLLPRGNKIDIDQDLGLEMGEGVIYLETIANARFGFTLDYQEFTFSGRSVLPPATSFKFYDTNFNAGDTVDSEFYIQYVGLGLLANLGALHKSDTRRIDLGLLMGGRYLNVNARMLDRTTGGRASDTLDAPVPFVGLKLTARYRDGIICSLQARAMNYEYGDYDLRNFVEGRVAFGFNIVKALDIEFGYAYSNTIFRREDKATGELFHMKHVTEGPYFSVILTF